MLPPHQPRQKHGTYGRATMYPWADQAPQTRWAICKRQRKVEPQGQDHSPAMDGIQNHFISEYENFLPQMEEQQWVKMDMEQAGHIVQ